MIERVVKLTLRKEELAGFIVFFQKNKAAIEGFKGCNSVKLLGEITDSGLLFTYSYWDSQDELNAYRNSDFFKETWAHTKSLFAAPAKAWSCKVLG